MQTARVSAGQLELRLPVDGAEAPFAYPDGEGCLSLEVALLGGGYASLVFPTGDARRWAGEAFAAISVAYREATGDPHALSDEELAALPPAEGYNPGPGLHVCAEGEARPYCASTSWSTSLASAWTAGRCRPGWSRRSPSASTSAGSPSTPAPCWPAGPAEGAWRGSPTRRSSG